MKTFPLKAILTITSERFVSKEGFEILQFMMDSYFLTPTAIPFVGEECRANLIEQFPELETSKLQNDLLDDTMDGSKDKDKDCDRWVEFVKMQNGMKSHYDIEKIKRTK